MNLTEDERIVLEGVDLEWRATWLEDCPKLNARRTLFNKGLIESNGWGATTLTEAGKQALAESRKP
jgi:hypothetical protein